jgi:hypothetical protein
LTFSTDGTIRIDYGFVNRAESSGTFYTRRLSYPVLFTVYRTLECFALDLASMRSDSQVEARQRLANGTTPRSTAFATSSDEELKRALARGDERSVLFCLNVRNVFSVPFEVALASAEGEGGSVVTRLVPPGATERLVLPIQRQSLSAEQRAQPIPSAGRQYVVDKQKKTADELALERETFWYRERLLDMVNVSWREPSSLRAGRLSLREQPLTVAHLEALRLNEVAVSLSVNPRNADGPKAMDFVDLHITVTNHLGKVEVLCQADPRTRAPPVRPPRGAADLVDRHVVVCSRPAACAAPLQQLTGHAHAAAQDGCVRRRAGGHAPITRTRRQREPRRGRHPPRVRVVHLPRCCRGGFPDGCDRTTKCVLLPLRHCAGSIDSSWS